MMNITIPYYEDKSRISNSDIGVFLKYGANYLHKYLNGEIDGLKGSFIDKGTMIHMYLLQPEKFWDEYILIDFKKPTSKQQKQFAELYANSVEIEPDKKAINTFEYVYPTRCIGLSDDKRLSKALDMIDKVKDYINYLKTATNKKTISGSDLAMLKQIQQNIENHKLAKMLIKDPEYTKLTNDDIESHNEFHINWEYKLISNGNKIPCKSLIDRCIFDPYNKVVTLIDLKTTSNIYDFQDSISKYDYCRQLEYYKEAIIWFLSNEKGISEYKYLTEWKIKIYIIAIESNNNHEIKVFEFTNSQINNRSYDIKNAIEEIDWHITNNLWEHSKTYYEGDGSETLPIL